LPLPGFSSVAAHEAACRHALFRARHAASEPADSRWLRLLHPYALVGGLIAYQGEGVAACALRL